MVKVYWCFQHNLGCIMPLELHFIIEIHFFSQNPNVLDAQCVGLKS